MQRAARALAPTGLALLARALPIWTQSHAAIEQDLPGGDPDGLRAALVALS